MRPAYTSSLNYIFAAIQQGRQGILSDMETVKHMLLLLLFFFFTKQELLLQSN